jgi:hypothetical protein
MAAMSFIDDIHTALSADPVLINLLTGGFYKGTGNDGVREISRQNTPDAFDEAKKIKPCILIVSNTDVKSGPYARSIFTTFSIYFYQWRGYDVIEPAMAKTFDLLHEQRIGENVWEINFSSSVDNQNDPALDCSLSTQRYVATRQHQSYQAP